MRLTCRRIAITFVFASAFIAPLASAQSPFDGTWRINMAKSTSSDKPMKLSLSDGVYDCSSCNPSIEVAADGKQHSVKGVSFDELSVRELNANSIEIVARKNGDISYEQTDTASADGKVLTIKRIEHSPDSKEASKLQVTAVRLGKAPTGANGVSGSWRIENQGASEDWLLSTYKTNGDELTYSAPNGEAYTAKLDGKNYPAKGGYAYNEVSLRRLGDRTIEETDKLNGKVVSVWKMTVSADGKTMTQVATWPSTGQTFTYIAEKQ